MNTWRIVVGDALERLRELDTGSVQTCVTSPPYFGLRDYSSEGQLGLEATPDLYVARLVEVFREVRRVLRDDGTLWLNLGDSYAGGKQGRADHGSGDPTSRLGPARDGLPNGTPMGEIAQRPVPPGYKPKDLLGIPWMVAFALRADGWYLRSDIIWAKKNCMPESVTDRPTKAHEYLFLLTKSKSYFYDADAVREPLDPKWEESHYRYYRELGGTRNHKKSIVDGKDDPGERRLEGAYSGRNKRSVWTVATAPFPGAHFAVFPPKLIEPCVLAGSAEDACGVCGAPWERVTGLGELDTSRPQARRALELADDRGIGPDHVAAIRAVGVSDAGKAQVTQDGFGKNHPDVQKMADEAKAALGGYYREFLLARRATTGWEPSCDHQDKTGTSTVLDPFAGAGTTGLVATRLGRSFIGIELNPEYAELARDRIRDDAPLMNYLIEAV